MSQIDLTQLINAADKEAWAAEAVRGAVKTECRTRIFAVVDEIAQINLAAAVAAGRLGPTDLATYQTGLDWIEAMRAACLPLIADPTLDPGAEMAWPSVPAGVADLADRF